MLIMEYVFPPKAGVGLVPNETGVLLSIFDEPSGVTWSFNLPADNGQYMSRTAKGLLVKLYAEENIDNQLCPEMMRYMLNKQRESDKAKLLARHARRVKAAKADKVDNTEAVVKGILEFVEREPYKSTTYYVRTAASEGGAPGSIDLKETVFKNLVKEGKIIRIDLEKPIARMKHAYKCAE